MHIDEEYGEGAVLIFLPVTNIPIPQVLVHIDEEYGEGAVLIFLPGMGDITAVLNALSCNRRFSDPSPPRATHSALYPHRAPSLGALRILELLLIPCTACGTGASPLPLPHLPHRSRCRVLPLHSTLAPQEQAAVFETMPPGVRKV